MASGGFSRLISTKWVGVRQFYISGNVLQNPPCGHSWDTSVPIGFLKFEYHCSFTMETREYLKVSLVRTPPKSKDEECLDGYDLMFYFTMVGFDDETKIDCMRGYETEVTATFKLSEATLEKVKNDQDFDLFVVVEMMEHKSLDETDHEKIYIEKFMGFLKKNLSDETAHNLAYILDCSPCLRNAFTGRLPRSDTNNLCKLLIRMSKESAEIAAYLDARYRERETDIDIVRLMQFLVLNNADAPIPYLIAVQNYIFAHRIGLPCYRFLTSDYLEKILDQDMVVIDVLVASVFVRDDIMFDKAARCFLNKMFKVTHSGKFLLYSLFKKWIARLIIHSTRRWYLMTGVWFKDLPLPKKDAETQTEESQAAESQAAESQAAESQAAESQAAESQAAES